MINAIFGQKYVHSFKNPKNKIDWRVFLSDLVSPLSRLTGVRSPSPFCQSLGCCPGRAYKNKDLKKVKCSNWLLECSPPSKSYMKIRCYVFSKYHIFNIIIPDIFWSSSTFCTFENLSFWPL